MKLSRLLLTTSLLLLLVPALGAQAPKYRWSPGGAANFPGGTNNTIPFWGQSATYQQVHDAADFGSAPVVMKGLAVRNSGARTVLGRTWDLRIKLSQTKVSAGTTTTTFATNLGSVNTTTVFGTATTWGKFTWKSFTSTGSVSPPSFTVPFSTSYLYIPALGNLCWEWRHQNASISTSMPMDAVSGSSHKGTIQPKVGQGCTVKGNTAPATATISTPLVTATGYNFKSVLSNATRSQAAVLALGVTPKQTNLGWCAAVELTPAVFLFGKTDTLGSWSFQAPLTSLAGAPPVTVYLQYAYNDTNEPAGLGLSNMAGYKTPNLPGANGMTRVWNTPSKNTTNSHAQATTGIVGMRYGLVVGWLQ
ncbi:MAG: hypothetical protein ACYTGW_20980 [Planctomycetota bacterium]|jgi:hypothetical protein